MAVAVAYRSLVAGSSTATVSVSGSNGSLEIAVLAASTPSSVTVGGSATGVQYVGPFGPGNIGHRYRLLSPASGVVQVNGTTVYVLALVFCTGVHQSMPQVDAGTDYQGSPAKTFSMELATVADGLLLSFATVTNGWGFSATDGASKLEEVDVGGGTRAAISGKAASGASTTTHWSTVEFGFDLLLHSWSLRPAATGYTLQAASATFAVASNATGLRAARKLTAAPRSYVLTGVAANLRQGRRLNAAAGTLSLIGPSTGLRVGRHLLAAAGAITYTGTTTGLRAARRLSMAPETFSWSGIDAAFWRGRTLSAEPATFVVGASAGGLLTSRRLVGGVATYHAAGIDSALRVARRITAAPGSLTWAGLDIALAVEGVVLDALGLITAILTLRAALDSTLTARQATTTTLTTRAETDATLRLQSDDPVP